MSPAASQYHDTAARIRAAIEAGRWPRGSQLPTEDDLAATLGVHRATVNRALGILRTEGLVRVHRGVGTFVTDIPPIRRSAVSRYSREHRERAGGRGAFDTEIRALGLEPRSDVTVTRGTPPQAAAGILGPGECVIRARRMYAGDTPVQIADSFIPAAIADGTPLESQDSGPGGIISRFADLGLAQARVTERLAVRPPTAEESAFLRMTPEQRVIAITHTGWTADDRPVEVCLHVMPAHLWDLEYEWLADPA